MIRRAAFIVFVAIAVGFFFGYLWGRQLTPLNQIIDSGVLSQDQQVATTSLMIDYGNGMVRVYPEIAVFRGESMIQLLEEQTKEAKLEFQTKEFAGMGVMVEKIGTKANGDENKYWQYCVNNVSIPYAASEYVIKAGDIIEWKFLHYK